MQRLRQPAWRRALAAAVLLQQAGCYVNAPMVGQSLAPGQRYTFELTDRGRVDLADRLGPSVESVEGTLVETADGSYQLRVFSVKSIGAPASHWSGERVAIPESGVARTFNRRLDKGRTTIAVAVAVVSIGTFIATRGLFGFGSGDNGERLPPPGGQ